MNAFSSGGENGTGQSGAAIAPDRGVQVLERLLGDRRRDLGAEAARAGVLVQDEHLGALLDAREHRLAIPGDQRAQIEDLDRDVVLLEPGRGLVGV